MIREWKQETGKTDVDMREVARFALTHGWRPPTPQSVIDLVAKEMADAARQEVRRDKETSRPYRVWHAYKIEQNNNQYTLWVDIDEAPRKPMLKSLKWRREMMVDDGVQLKRDADHWNRINPGEEPIQLVFDIGPDIEWREAGEDAEKEDEDEAA
jgi:hypothetical protein